MPLNQSEREELVTAFKHHAEYLQALTKALQEHAEAIKQMRIDIVDLQLLGSNPATEPKEKK
jgi:hypothetical protein